MRRGSGCRIGGKGKIHATGGHLACRMRGRVMLMLPYQFTESCWPFSSSRRWRPCRPSRRPMMRRSRPGTCQRNRYRSRQMSVPACRSSSRRRSIRVGTTWKTGEDWRKAADAMDAGIVPTIPIAERLHVKIEPATMDGVKVFVVTPDEIPPKTATGCSFISMVDATNCSPARRARPRRSPWPGWSISR